MDNIKGVLLFLTIILGVSTFYLFVQSTSRGHQLDAAQETNRLTLELLRAQGSVCSATKSNYEGVGECIIPLLHAKDFKQDSFAQPNAKTDEPGYLVITNINAQAYASSNFTFLFNRQVLQEGCTIPGNITKGVTCRFNFNTNCVDGDVLEVEYTKGNVTSKVFTKTC